MFLACDDKHTVWHSMCSTQPRMDGPSSSCSMHIASRYCRDVVDEEALFQLYVDSTLHGVGLTGLAVRLSLQSQTGLQYIAT